MSDWREDNRWKKATNLAYLDRYLAGVVGSRDPYLLYAHTNTELARLDWAIGEMKREAIRLGVPVEDIRSGEDQ